MCLNEFVYYNKRHFLSYSPHMKKIRLLINNFHSTRFNYVARETELIRGVEVLNIQIYVLLETVGKNSAVFIVLLYKVV